MIRLIVHWLEMIKFLKLYSNGFNETLHGSKVIEAVKTNSHDRFSDTCVVCQLITWAGLIRHPACRSALIVPFLTKPPALRLRHTLPHCVHCWKLIQSSILYFLCRSPCSSASQTTHCATIQFLTQSRAQSLLRHLSTLDRVNFLLLYFIYRALFLTKIYANE